MTEKTTSASEKILDGLQDALMRVVVAKAIQSWHCSQTSVPPPCGPDCACWLSVDSIIAAYERGKGIPA